MLPHIAVLSDNPKATTLLTGIDPPTLSIQKPNQCTFYKSDKYVLMSDHFNKNSIRNRINLISQADAAILVLSDKEDYSKRISDYLQLIKFFRIPLAALIYDTDTELELINSSLDSLNDLIERIGVSVDRVAVIGTCLDKEQLPETMQMLKDALNRQITATKLHPSGLMIIDSINSRLASTLISGRVLSGDFHVGNNVVISGYGKNIYSTIANIQSYKLDYDKVVSGEQAGFLLQGVDSSEIQSGQVMSNRGVTPVPLRQFNAKLHLLTYREFGRTTPFTDGYSPLFYFNAIPARGDITIKEDAKYAAPGQLVEISVVLEQEIPFIAMSFLVCDEDRLVGMGKICKSSD